MMTLFLLAVVGGIGFFVLSNLRAKNAREEHWKQFAASRQLGFAYGQIAGVVSGFTVAMLVEKRGDGEGSYQATVVRCSLNGAVPDDLKISRETVASKVLQLFGRTDHQLGIPQMDQAFHLDGVGEQARRVLSDRGAQERLLAMLDRYPELRIGRGVVQLEQTGVVATEEELSRMLGDAVSVATALQRAAQRS